MSDRDNPGNSVQPDGVRIHNQRHHWLFKKTDELGNATVYQRDDRRRVTNIYYYDASNTRVASEAYTYNQCNQVTSHTLPSTTVVYYQYNTLNQLELEYNSVQGYNERTEYSYDGLERVERMRDPRAVADGVSCTTLMKYNGRNRFSRLTIAILLAAAPTRRSLMSTTPTAIAAPLSTSWDTGKITPTMPAGARPPATTRRHRSQQPLA